MATLVGEIIQSTRKSVLVQVSPTRAKWLYPGDINSMSPSPDLKTITFHLTQRGAERLEEF